MSQENTNLSAPSRMGNGSPENGGFIDWYDSPKILFPTQCTKLRRSVQFKKTRSAEEFSPHRSYLNDTGSTLDLDSIWCITPSQEPATSEGGETSSSTLFDEEASTKSDQTTPHRSNASAKLFSRKRRRKPELFEEPDTKKESPGNRRVSIEEGLAFGKASLAKLRQRLKSEGDVNKTSTNVKSTPRRTPLRAALQPSSNVSPTSSLGTLKKNGETVLTPSLARQTQRFIASTPKSSKTVAGTPLKRFRTMDDSPSSKTGLLDTTKDKILRTQSLDVTGDNSDDDSFLDDVFVPFTDPSQFTEMLTHNSTQKS